jgi:hypothetical protein
MCAFCNEQKPVLFHKSSYYNLLVTVFYFVVNNTWFSN